MITRFSCSRVPLLDNQGFGLSTLMKDHHWASFRSLSSRSYTAITAARATTTTTTTTNNGYIATTTASAATTSTKNDGYRHYYRCKSTKYSNSKIGCSDFISRFDSRNEKDGSGRRDNEHRSGNSWKMVPLLGLISATGIVLRDDVKKDGHSGLSTVTKDTEQFGAVVSGLPVYNLDQVSKHNTKDTRVWVAFRNGVYDITDFIAEHPGGDKILLGAGGSVEPFWALYAIHKTPTVLAMLEKYRIGNLAPEEVNTSVADMADPYAREPRRHITLRPSSVQPFNAEPPPALLVDNYITPNELFYVRNHLPVPEVDLKDYELEVTGDGITNLSLTLDDLKALPKHTVTVAIQCAGNRRSEMTKVKAVKGLSWGHAAISNATWSGARLSDVLKQAGIKEDQDEELHVQFEGLDLDPTSHPYGASIPIEKALDPRGDVLLAYEMNGDALPRDHGFPVRAVVPGVVGARNVKWLGRIIVSHDESPSHWQQNDYKGFAPNVGWDTVDFSKSPAIQELPVMSAICDPGPDQLLKVSQDGKVKVRGYAYSGGGRKIVRVDVSGDGGHTWQSADGLMDDKSRHPRSWGWCLWTAEVPVPDGVNTTQLCAKAVDSQYNTQPENFDNIWNLRGVLANAYHRVNVQLVR